MDTSEATEIVSDRLSAVIGRKPTPDEIAVFVLGYRTGEEFARRPLDSIVLKAHVDAWDEGFEAGERDVFMHEERGWDAPCIENPYRKAGE